MNEADAQSIRDAGRGHLLGSSDGGSPPVTRADVNVDGAGTREDEWEALFRPHKDDDGDIGLDEVTGTLYDERDFSSDEFDEGEGDFID